MRPPLLLVVNIHHEDRCTRLWLPLFLIWIVLLPFALVLLPFVLLGMEAAGLRPLRSLGALLAVFCNLAGTRIDVARPDSLVFLQIVRRRQ